MPSLAASHTIWPKLLMMWWPCLPGEYKRNEELPDAHVKQLANLEAHLMALEEGMPKLDSSVVLYTKY